MCTNVHNTNRLPRLSGCRTSPPGPNTTASERHKSAATAPLANRYEKSAPNLYNPCAPAPKAARKRRRRQHLQEQSTTSSHHHPNAAKRAQHAGSVKTALWLHNACATGPTRANPQPSTPNCQRAVHNRSPRSGFSELAVQSPTAQQRPPHASQQGKVFAARIIYNLFQVAKYIPFENHWPLRQTAS